MSSFLDSGEAKKCRARFGVNQTEKWCAPCRRKKKCIFVGDEAEGRVIRERLAEGSGETSSGKEEDGTERSCSTQQRASDSESELEDEPMATVEDLLNVKMEE